MKYSLLLTLVVVGVIVFGCSGIDPDVDKPVHELFENGMDEFNDEDYRKAIELFGKVRDWYPFSQYAKTAELKIADAHFLLEDYDEAIAAYRDFEELHPKNESIPYVIYQTGLCYFNRLGTIDREQTMAVKSIELFDRLIKSFPESSYAQDAQEKIRQCRISLAEHDFYIGHFYYKTKRYKAALYRFNKIVETYPGFDAAVKAKEYIPLCEAALVEETNASD